MMNNQHHAPGQPITVPPDMVVPWHLTIGEAAVVFQALGELPEKMSGMLKVKLGMQTNAHVTQMMSPPVPAKATDKEFQASFPLGRAALTRAEEVRREPNGSLDVAIRIQDQPEDDYAANLQLVAGGLQHLDEALPNGQRDRVVAGYLSARHGLEMFRRWLDKRLDIPPYAPLPESAASKLIGD